MSERAPPGSRADYRHFRAIPTRWMDNDVYGHVNNVVYYSFFDTMINAFLIESGGLDIHSSPVIGLAVETKCRFHAPLAFPQTVDAGLRIGHLGARSVRYEVGLFAPGNNSAAAEGHFVHVFVDRATRRPVPIPEKLRHTISNICP